MTSLSINGRSYDVDVDPDTPLLWVFATRWDSPVTKCGCGSPCAVPVPSTSTASRAQLRARPVSSVGSRAMITTIEAMSDHERQEAPGADGLARPRRGRNAATANPE